MTTQRKRRSSPLRENSFRRSVAPWMAGKSRRYQIFIVDGLSISGGDQSATPREMLNRAERLSLLANCRAGEEKFEIVPVFGYGWDLHHRLISSRHIIAGFSRANCTEGDSVTRDDLMAFIRQDIGSVYALELLLLIKRHSGKSWRAADLVHELRSSATAVAEALSRLTDAGFVLENAGRYGFAPRSPRHDRIAKQIEEIYRSTPISVVKAIVEAPGRSGPAVEHK